MYEETFKIRVHQTLTMIKSFEVKSFQSVSNFVNN